MLSIRFIVQDGHTRREAGHDDPTKSHPAQDNSRPVDLGLPGRPTLLPGGDVSFLPARRRHARYIHKDITRAPLDEHMAGVGYPQKQPEKNARR
jgi:hypothetical protein